jgi:hypothetical protein
LSGGTGRPRGLPPAGDAAVDEPLVAREADVRAEAEALRRARPEAFDQRVCALDEPQHDLGCALLLEVERDGRATAAERFHERPAVVRGGRRPVDPDDVGAEVGEHHRGERPGPDAGQLDHPEVGQRPTPLRRHAARYSPPSKLR